MTANTPDGNKTATANWNAFNRAYDAGHEKYVREATRFSDFYLSDQWDEEAKAKLEKLGKPALTINMIQKVVNSIRGHYSSQRADFQFKPRREARPETAESLTRLFDHIMDDSGFHTDIEPQMVEDGLIEDRGYIDARISFDENLLGEVQLRDLDPRSVVPDPDAVDYDTSKWNEVWIDRWMTLDDVETFYGRQKRDQVKFLAEEPHMTFGDKSVRYGRFGGDDVTQPEIEGERRVRSVRVIERQYKRLSMAKELVDLRSGEFRPVPNSWEEGRAEALVEQVPYLALRKAMRKRVRWTVSADSILLHDDWSPYPEFTVVAYFPMFRRGKPSGVVRPLIDPQVQLNKVESQVLHIVNSTANSGWVVQAGSLVNMTEAELESRGAETGLVVVYNGNKEAPQKIQPNQVPTGLEQFTAKSRGYINEISGAGALLGDAPTSEVSGVALDRSQSKALVGLQVVFDNLQRTRRILAKRVLNLIQAYYTEQRIFHITNWRDPEQSEEQLIINEQAATGEIANDLTVGEYEVVVGFAPARDTFEETQFAEALQLREAGIMIPDHHVILASNLAGKRKIAEEVKQQTGFGEPTELDQMMQELQIRTAQAELAELEAKVAKLESETGLTAAKAQTEVAAEQREAYDMLMRYKMEGARLRSDLTKKMADYRNKLELAEMHTGAKAGLTQFTERTKAHEKDKDRETTLRTALISAQSKASGNSDRSRDR